MDYCCMFLNILRDLVGAMFGLRSSTCMIHKERITAMDTGCIRTAFSISARINAICRQAS